MGSMIVYQIHSVVFTLGWMGGERPVPQYAQSPPAPALASAVGSGRYRHTLSYLPHTALSGVTRLASATPACKARQRADSVAHVASGLCPALWDGTASADGWCIGRNDRGRTHAPMLERRYEKICLQ